VLRVAAGSRLRSISSRLRARSVLPFLLFSTLSTSNPKSFTSTELIRITERSQAGDSIKAAMKICVSWQTRGNRFRVARIEFCQLLRNADANLRDAPAPFLSIYDLLALNWSRMPQGTRSTARRREDLPERSPIHRCVSISREWRETLLNSLENI
jgi:hypothetical protein